MANAKIKLQIYGKKAAKLTFANKAQTEFLDSAASGNDFEVKVWWDSPTDPTSTLPDNTFTSPTAVTRASGGLKNVWITGGWMAADGDRYLSMPKQKVIQSGNKFANPQKPITVTLSGGKLVFKCFRDFVGFDSDNSNVYVTSDPITFKNSTGHSLTIGSTTIANNSQSPITFTSASVSRSYTGGSGGSITNVFQWSDSYAAQQNKPKAKWEFRKFKTMQHMETLQPYRGRPDNYNIATLSVYNNRFTMHGQGDFAFYAKLAKLRWEGGGNYDGLRNTELYYTFAGTVVLNKMSNLVKLFDLTPTIMEGVFAGAGHNKNVSASWDAGKPAGLQCTDMTGIVNTDYMFEYSTFNGNVSNYGETGTLKSVVGMFQHTSYNKKLERWWEKLHAKADVTNMFRGNTSFNKWSFKKYNTLTAVGASTMLPTNINDNAKHWTLLNAEVNSNFPTASGGSDLSTVNCLSLEDSSNFGDGVFHYKPFLTGQNPSISIKPQWSNGAGWVQLEAIWDSISVDKSDTGFLYTAYAEYTGYVNLLDLWDNNEPGETQQNEMDWNSISPDDRHPIEIIDWYLVKNSAFTNNVRSGTTTALSFQEIDNANEFFNTNDDIAKLSIVSTTSYNNIWDFKQLLQTGAPKSLQFKVGGGRTASELSTWIGDSPMHIICQIENRHAGAGGASSADVGSGGYDYFHPGDFSFLSLKALN